ncbi:MAG: arylsulfotransferase family protein [Ignavibacteriaceae bacterium]
MNTLGFAAAYSIIIILVLFTSFSFGQSNTQFEYVNPLPGSKYVSPETNIIIKPGSFIDKSSITPGLILVTGSRSGIHKGKFLLSDDLRTLVFNPTVKFSPYEEVAVKLNDGIKTIDGKNIGSFTFRFFINREPGSGDVEKINYLQGENDSIQLNKNPVSVSSVLSSPPVLKVDTSENPSPGCLFIGATPYLMIVDNEATPVFYRNISGSIFDFKLQPNGLLTYFIYPVSCYGLDSSFNLVRTFNTANGYGVDVHDLRVLPNGHYYILGKKLVSVDMSKIVSGGDSSAQIIDMALQEFDDSNNVVFQWSALDHYQITDADQYVDLMQHTIDFVHINSIEIDNDGNIMVSARNLDEITKIDHNSGDIIWRLGGKNNQFTFINDDRGFSRQHDIRRLSNGDITIFDNGVYHSPAYSSMVEYSLDEQNKTAALVNRYSHNNNILSRTRGDIEELPNGNKLISWGEVIDPAVTEIRPDNSIAYEMSFISKFMRFHTYKFSWKTNLFNTNVDSVNFGKIAGRDSAKKNITIFNPHNATVIINQFFCKEASFSVLNQLPVSIPAKDSAVITVKFAPVHNGVFNDILNIRFIDTTISGNVELIANQVYLSGSTISLINPVYPPSNLVASSIEKKIKLTWKDNSDNESGFVIEKKTGDSTSRNSFFVIDTVSANDTSYTDSLVTDSVDYTYRVYAFNSDTISSFSNYSSSIVTSVKSTDVVKRYALYQNYPNPFNPATNIKYEIPKPGLVTIDIFNILGQKVKTLLNKYQNAGRYSIRFDASDLPSGIYFYRLKVNQFTAVKKLVLLR